MIQFDRKTLRDKIYSCWVGKNIGGTMGTPYEGKRQFNDIKGFSTEPGTVLPNDDLDLQLVWLRAISEVGPENLDERTLAEYWLAFIGPHWNEYGVGKSNMREGLVPPLSGQMCNEDWLDSNGAWIRTEIWACLYPGSPEDAIRMAFYDACCDHGYGEGTYAAIFVAAMESAAFIFNDISTLLAIGLSKIPQDCRVAKAVKLVMAEYEKGTDWKTTRNMLVEQSADIGWFMAPANVGFAVLGLLYGECDFKKSMTLAINCGDDTDCTGATVGALLGIMGGSKAIPADWKQYIGDSIVTCCNLKGHGVWPATNEELTDDVMNMHPVTLRKAFGQIAVGDENRFDQVSPESFYGDEFVREMFSRSPYSFRERTRFCEVWVEWDQKPVIQPGETVSGKISVIKPRFTTMPSQNLPGELHYRLRWMLPEGWTAAGRKNLCSAAVPEPKVRGYQAEFSITAGETVEAVNRLVLEVDSVSRTAPVYVPIVLLG